MVGGGLLFLWVALVAASFWEAKGGISPEEQATELLDEAQQQRLLAQELLQRSLKGGGEGDSMDPAVLEALFKQYLQPYNPPIPDGRSGFGPHFWTGVLGGVLLLLLGFFFLGRNANPLARAGFTIAGAFTIIARLLLTVDARIENKGELALDLGDLYINMERTICETVIEQDTLSGFAVANASVDSLNEEKITGFLNSMQRILSVARRDSLRAVFVVGQVDKRPLLARSRKEFGGNETLGMARANAVCNLLLHHAEAPEDLGPKLIPISAGAPSYGKAISEETYATDRAVRVVALWSRCHVIHEQAPNWYTRTRMLLVLALEALAALGALVGVVAQILDLYRARKAARP